jgi:hypothetical protein
MNLDPDELERQADEAYRQHQQIKVEIADLQRAEIDIKNQISDKEKQYNQQVQHEQQLRGQVTTAKALRASMLAAGPRDDEKNPQTGI